MAIRTLIVDDMELARKRVRRHLQSNPALEIVGEAQGGLEAIEMIRRLEPQLLVLDVQMPEVDGFDVLEAIDPERMPAVIFVTAHDEFALRAFDVHAIDYLLKPFDEERLAKAVERAGRLVGNPHGDMRPLRALIDDVGRERRERRLMIRVDGRTLFVRPEDIDFIEAAGNYLRIQTGGASYMVREKIGQMEERLAESGFVRIHRSTIVNASRVKELQPMFNGDQAVILASGKRLTMSRTYRGEAVPLIGRF